MTDSVLGPHVSIGPGAVIKGSRLSDCVVGPGSRLTGCELDRSLVGENCLLSGVAGEVNVGDYTELENRDRTGS